MDDKRPDLTVIDGGGSGRTRKTAAGIEIPAPPPGHNLDRQGMRIYDWICEALIDDGRQVKSAGMQIVLIVHAFLSWSSDMKLVIELGRYGQSPNGAQIEFPHSYNERRARDEIKRELPEACLTVMSNIEARLRESKIEDNRQDDLFADLQQHGRGRPSAA